MQICQHKVKPSVAVDNINQKLELVLGDTAESINSICNAKPSAGCLATSVHDELA